ncbi:MAG: hypothetical protein JSS63_14650 [Bacteroidetes bacterium]|nr:hypothetical protein [Bacteroidota bacterium]
MKTRTIFSYVLFALITICLNIPFVLNIFYLHTLDFYIILLFDFVTAALVIIFLILFFILERRKYFRIALPVVIFLVSIFFFISYNWQMSFADYVFFKMRKKKLNEFVYRIKQYGKITEMSEPRVENGSLNDSLFTYNPGHLSKDGKGYTHLYFDLIKEIKIEEGVHKEFINMLKDVNCSKFQVNKDGGVCFTIKGVLFQSVGISYSPNGEKFVTYGTAKEWKQLDDNWYFWGN